MLPSVLVAARRELAARVSAMSVSGVLGGGPAAATTSATPYVCLMPTWGDGRATTTSASLAAPPTTPTRGTSAGFATAAAAASAAAVAAAPPLARLSSAAAPGGPRPRGRPPIERASSLPQPSGAAAPSATTAGAATGSSSSSKDPPPLATAPLRARLKALGLDGLAVDRVASWTSPDTGYQPALANPSAVERRVEAFARRLGARGASRLLAGNPNVLNLQDARLDETLRVLADEVGRAAAGELDAGGAEDGGGGDDDNSGGAGSRRKATSAAAAAASAGGPPTSSSSPPDPHHHQQQQNPISPAAEEAARTLLLRNHYLLSHARGTLRSRARAALSAVRRVPGCASPPSRAARALLAQPRLLSSSRLAARCDFLAALEATDPHRPAMARRWAGISPATVALVLSHRSAALLRLLYLQRAPMRAAAALGASVTSAVTAPAAEFVAGNPGWAAWERALARLPQADVDRCLRELRPPPTLAGGGGGGGGGGEQEQGGAVVPGNGGGGAGGSGTGGRGGGGG